MGSIRGKGWIVAASIGAVEALKDHGFCRWNYTIRSIHQHYYANKSINILRPSRSSPNINKQLSSSSSSSSSMVSSSSSNNKVVREEESRRLAHEESFRTVMYLSCWGPNY